MMIKKILKIAGASTSIFIFNYIIMFCCMYVLDYIDCPFSIMGYLTAILLAITDYIFMFYLYKNAKITPKIIVIISVLIINGLSNITADKLIHSDDAFAILEGSKIIANAQILLLITIIIIGFKIKRQ